MMLLARPRSVTCFVSLVSAALVAACGGSKSSDLFGKAQPPSAMTLEAGAGSGGSGTSGASTQPEAVTQDMADAGAAPGAFTGTEPSAPADSGSGPFKPPGDGNPPKDAGATVTEDTGRVLCGSERDKPVYCAAGSFCCAERERRSDQFRSFTCTADANACKGESQLAIICDDSNDCLNPGMVCCASRATGGRFARYVRTACVAPDECLGPVNGENRVRLCDSSDTADECRAINQKCSESLSLNGFEVCQ